jgi:hypothetical protein
MRHFLIRKLVPAPIPPLPLGMLARPMPSALINPACTPSRGFTQSFAATVIAILLAAIALLTQPDLPTARTTVEDSVMLIDDASTSSFLDLR